MKRIGLLLLLVVLAAGSVWGVTINVPADHATIQAAIDATVDGDTVLVAAGTYVEFIDFKSKIISLIGADSNTTFIDGRNAPDNVQTVIIRSDNANKPLIESLTILNGHGGIRALGAIIRSCVIRDSQWHGLFPRAYSLLLEGNNTIENSVVIASIGPPIGVHTGRTIMTNCTIINETDEETFLVNSDLDLINCVIHAQKKLYHRQLAAADSNPTFSLSYCFLNYDISSGLKLSESVWPNEAAEVVNSGQIEIGDGIIYGIPSFVDTANGNYRLSDSSPCIGAGILNDDIPKFDIAGNLRPNPAGSKPDIGAYENPLSSPIVNIPDPNLRAALEKALGKNEGDAITKEDLAGVEELIARNQGKADSSKISDLTGLQNCKNLKHLNLSYNPNISDLSAISSLQNLSFLDLQGITSLVDITFLSNLVKLTELYIGYERVKLEDISPLSNLTSLKKLSIWHADVLDISKLSTLINLEYLTIAHNHKPITDITFLQNLPNLKHLDLRGWNRPALKEVSPIKDLDNLEYLNLGGNLITDISPLSNLVNLVHLNLNGNGDLSNISPLENLSKLTKLYLYSNSIVDITPLSKLTNLQDIKLYSNQITDISPLVENAGISGTIKLKNNPLNNTALSTHIPALEARGIKVEYNLPEGVVLFKDANLEKAIRDALGIPTELLKKEDLTGI